MLWLFIVVCVLSGVCNFACVRIVQQLLTPPPPPNRLQVPFVLCCNNSASIVGSSRLLWCVIIGNVLSSIVIDSIVLAGTWLSWMAPVWHATDDDVQQAGGRDASDFVDLMRTLLGVVCVLCVLSLSIALPVNMHGTIGLSGFSQTTISNLDTIDEVYVAVS